MKKDWKLRSSVIIGVISIVLAGCSSSTGGMDHSKMKMENISDSSTATTALTVEPVILTGKVINLVATQSNQEIASGKSLPVWTYNNSVPGPQIRVKQGETIKVNLKNELPEPITIHWHGFPVPNSMDGIPGVTQNAVQSGESFTYEFKADVPGTYWYHSHQDSVNQLDRGLYGSFIVEGTNDEKVDRDYTLMLDEWISSGIGMSEMNSSGMEHSGMNMNSDSASTMDNSMDNMSMGDDMSMYDLFSINGRSGSLVEQLPVKQGEKVRLRLINAGYLSHQIHLHGHEFKVIATDGQPINNPSILKDNVVSIAPGERYDIEFVANNPGQWLIEDHSDNKAASGMRAVIAYEGVTTGSDISNASEKIPAVDLTSYGQAGNKAFTLDQKYNLEYTMYLNTEMKNGNIAYTINDKTFPDTDALTVNEGDTVKVRLVNNSKGADHPMHLHGHFFQVMSKNGKPVQGSPVFKDTINVRPGEEYVVAFEANNPGNWMFHCHDLHHASAGMVMELKYKDYKSDFVADPNAANMPE
jgi:FtsP/CotA-like multicopper oxidase with cupredoxin domain